MFLIIKQSIGIIQGMCGSPMIQQQSAAHKDVTQRLMRKQRSTPKRMVRSPCVFG